MQDSVKVSGVSSMATRLLLADLTQAFSELSAIEVGFTSVGGVDAVKRMQAGEHFDVVVLARDAIDKLAASRHVVAGSGEDWVHSSVAIAMREDAAYVAADSESALRRAVLAHKVGYSTGPSGSALLLLFERWGILEEMRERLVQAPAGISVANLVADGRVDMGFQQLSELTNVPGVRVLGLLPKGCEIVSTFSTAIGTAAEHLSEVREFLTFMHSTDAAEIVHRHGMSPVREN
ncbi:substrate-binding domain-containing protein [Uliginosibacterium sp. H3]|uniref:Substrate-binding domain-containing protein n=1 Tax=Uliginosibacterium silvisoli TaxID=3114758 RepID=A0ABU6K567_9RHOO|nr:substrate-binding domain-containing protein [Uliginosibacterium sp. H3]